MSLNLESVVKSTIVAGAILASGSSLNATESPGYFSQAKASVLSLFGYQSQAPKLAQAQQAPSVQYSDSFNYRRTETTYQSPHTPAQSSKASSAPTKKDDSTRPVVKKKKKHAQHNQSSNHSFTSTYTSKSNQTSTVASAPKAVSAKPVVKPASAHHQDKKAEARIEPRAEQKQYKSEAPAPVTQPTVEKNDASIAPGKIGSTVEELNYSRSFSFGTPATENTGKTTTLAPDGPSTTYKPHTPSNSYWEGTMLVGKFSENFSTNTTKYDAKTGIGKITHQPDLAVNGSMFKMQVAKFSPRLKAAVNFTSAKASDVGEPAGNYSSLCGQYYTTTDLGLHVDGIVLKSEKFPVGLALGASLQTWNAKTFDYFNGETSNQNNQIYAGRGAISFGQMDKSFLIAGVEQVLQPIMEKYQGTDGVAYTARATNERTKGFFAKARYLSSDKKLVADLEFHSGTASTQYASDNTSLITNDSKFSNFSAGVGYTFNPNSPGLKLGAYGQMKTANSPAAWQDALKRGIVSNNNDANSFVFGVSVRW